MDGELCVLADDPETFASRVVEILADPERARAMVTRARQEVVARWDSHLITEKLVSSYRAALRQKGATLSDPLSCVSDRA